MVARGVVVRNVDGRRRWPVLGGTGDSVQCGWEGQTFGADHPDPTRPRGGGAVQTHCRLSRASREQTLYGNRVEGRADHSDPTRPRGGWRSANALQAQQSQPRADPAWLSGGGQTTQTPEGPEGGWRSANALQAQQSQPPADPVW